jgi:hypothetical protein
MLSKITHNTKHLLSKNHAPSKNSPYPQELYQEKAIKNQKLKWEIIITQRTRSVDRMR